MKKFFVLLPLLLLCFFSCSQKSKKYHPRSHSITENIKFKNWMNFHPEEEAFCAFFPTTPITSSRDLPIPGNDGLSLPYKEFVCQTEDGVLFSICYTILPDDWLAYGSSLVLKQALKVIVNERGKIEIVGKKITSFKSFPAMDYEHYTLSETNQKETTGTLVLIGKTLYKIELTYPPALHDQIQDEIIGFIEGFCPKTSGCTTEESLN